MFPEAEQIKESKASGSVLVVSNKHINFLRNVNYFHHKKLVGAINFID
jgi:hypothetical protein